MIKINSKQLFGEEFHSAEMDIKELKGLIKAFVSKSNPGDEVKSFDINKDGIIDIVLESGEEIEVEVDWNELILK